ncbi:hypothetical protein [Candidatus Nitrotoga sp. BS]|uniref:hypothetical protein n=1 Tax=Candidatus Nitrotoga sp. BS TaxID=2890408 RepID=UPI001EF3A47D|nr:hypothetical protein [Candidatus Nitrotoga sp. BS]
MPIIEVNHITKEYPLGTIQNLKTTTRNQWCRLTDQPAAGKYQHLTNQDGAPLLYL